MRLVLVAAAFLMASQARADSLQQVEATQRRSNQAADAGSDAGAKGASNLGFGEAAGTDGSDATQGSVVSPRKPGLRRFTPSAKADAPGAPDVPGPAPETKPAGRGPLSKGLMYGAAAGLGALQGALSGGLFGALSGAAVALGAAYLFSKGDYGGAFGVSVGGIIGGVVGGPLGAVIGAVAGGILGHFVGMLFFGKRGK